jgi:hypothetical protein
VAEDIAVTNVIDFPVKWSPERQVTQAFSIPQVTWYEPTVKRLTELVTSLEHNWDGYGGSPVEFVNAHFALNILHDVCWPHTEPPSIVPGAHGDLQLEWHTEKFDIEMHILAPYRIQAYRRSFANEHTDEEDLELGSDFTVVRGWVREMEAEIAPELAAS